MIEQTRPRERSWYRSGRVVSKVTVRPPGEWNVRAGKDADRAWKDPGS